MIYLKAYLGEILHAGYIAPTANRNLLLIYLCAALGVFGMAFFDVFMAVNLYGQGMVALVSYFLVRIIGNSMIGMPVGFSLISKCSPKALAIISSVYLVSTTLSIVLLYGHIPDYFIAALTSLVYVPFWLVYHSSMLHYSSSDNRGNEVAIGHICMALGGIMGGLLAGACMYYNISFIQGCVIGFIVVLSATLFLISFARSNNIFQNSSPLGAKIKECSVLEAVFHNKKLTLLTILGSSHTFATTALWPVWLTIIGASGLAVGVLYSATIGVKLVISPIVGRVTNLRRSSDLQIGSLVQAVGWLPWLLSLNPMTTLISSAFFSSGAHFFNVGLETRWYDTKTYTHLAAREINLAIGRLLVIMFVLPVLFFAPEYFVFAGLIMCGLIWACSYSMSSDK